MNGHSTHRWCRYLPAAPLRRDVAEELKRAQEQLSLVSIDRRDFDDVEGYIVGLGDEWLLMALAAVTANEALHRCRHGEVEDSRHCQPKLRP